MKTVATQKSERLNLSVSAAGGKLTTLSFVLLVAVNEKETGALGSQRQQDALGQGGDEGEPQQQGPEAFVPHDEVNTENL